MSDRLPTVFWSIEEICHIEFNIMLIITSMLFSYKISMHTFLPGLF